MLVLRIGAYTTAFLTLVAVVGLSPSVAVSYPQGAPAGFAGDIVDPFSGVQTCAVGGCHSSYDLNSGTGSVSISAPASAFPGETVQITVTVDNQTAPASGSQNVQGFQATVRDTAASGGYTGTMVVQDAANTRMPFGSSNYITHTQTGTSQTSWTFGWTVPSATVPTQVRVFAAGNAANGGDLPDSPGNNAAGDYIYTTSTTIDIMANTTEEGPGVSGLALGVPSPNPLSSEGHVSIHVDAPTIVSFQIVDGLGRVVRPIPDRAYSAGTTEVRFSTSGLRSGTYFIVAETEAGRQAQAFQVVR